MANVRIIYNDAAERATISVSGGSSAAGYDPQTLKTNTKSLAHRSNSTSITYTLSWAAAEQINCVILPATNLSSTATITVNSGGTTYANAVPACASTPLDGHSGSKNVNSFPYGGLSKTAVWFSTTPTLSSLNITLTDNNKTALGYPGYIDCSRIVCGKYWEPQYGVDKDSLQLTVDDTTQTSRSDSGDLYSDRGTIYEQLSFNLGVITKSDREELIKLLRTVGNYKNIAISVFPETNTNTRNEQDYIIYGKRETSSISYLVHNYYSSSFSITGW